MRYNGRNRHAYTETFTAIVRGQEDEYKWISRSAGARWVTDTVIPTFAERGRLLLVSKKT